MTLRASDPCRLLVLSRNAAAATEHAQCAGRAAAAPTSLGRGKGRSRRLGVQQQRALAMGCLDSARDLHRGAGWAPPATRVTALCFFFLFSFFHHFLRRWFVCLKILQHSFCCILAPWSQKQKQKQAGGVQGRRTSTRKLCDVSK